MKNTFNFKKFDSIKLEIYFILFSFLILWINIRSLSGAELIFSGDQYFPFNLLEVKKNLAGIFDYKNLGINSAWKFNIHFIDNLIYYTLYSLKISPKITQYLIHFTIFYLILRLSYDGFKKFSMANLLCLSNIQIFSVAFLYSYSPYFVQLLHGTVVNVTLAVAYGLMPLTFFKFNQYFLSSEFNYKNGITLSIFISLILLPFWFFASFGLFLLFYFIYILIIKKRNYFFIKIFYLMATLVPLLGFQIFNIFYEKISGSGLNPEIDSPVFGNISGGMLTQLKMLHSWGIYNIWHPRFLYPFVDHYYSNIYNITLILLYSIIIFGIYKSLKINNNLKSLLLFFITLFLVSTFLAKGPSYPFGFIFIYLYENIPLFSIFRTPDIRFGYLIIFCISYIFLLIYNNFKYKLYIKLIVITTILSLPFFNGEALTGKNIGNIYIDKIIKIPESYYEVASFLNNNTTQNDFVFDLSMNDYELYNIDKDLYVGQNILQKLVHSPMVFASKSAPMNFQTIEILKFIKNSNNFNLLNNYPIKFIVLRKNSVEHKNFKFTKDLNLVFENTAYYIYQSSKVKPLLGDCDSVINYKNYSYLVTLTQPCKEITLALNYSNGWRAIKLSNENSSFFNIWFLKAVNIFNESVIRSKPSDYYQISFDLHAQPSNKNDIYVIYHEPNFIFKFLLYIYFIFLVIYIFIIFKKNTSLNFLIKK